MKENVTVGESDGSSQLHTTKAQSSKFEISQIKDVAGFSEISVAYTLNSLCNWNKSSYAIDCD